VFTLPHELNALAAVQPRCVYETLLQIASATLGEFAANPRAGSAASPPSHWCCTPGRRICAAIFTSTP